MRLKQCIFALMAMLLCAFSANAQGGSVAKIGNIEYTTFAEALTAASEMSGDVTIEVYDKVTLNTAFSGSYSSINFVGKDTDAEIYLDVQGYITATGKKVSFTDLKLSKSAGGFITNAGFMNVAFGIYDVTEVAYTNCVFANGAYAGSGNVTFNDCTFYRSHDKYGLWAYGDVNATVEGCTFADYRGIKMYAEGAAKTVDLTVKNTDFSALTGKPAIVLTYGESVVLEGNTYSSTGTFELDLGGAPNGTAVTSDVAPTCKNDNGTCGVLVDGKIYTTAAQAAEVATEGSNVTLLYSTTDTVEFAEGVNLTLANGVIADNVTVATSGVASLSGEGTAENPYLIETLEDLKFFRDDVNTYTQDGSNQYKGKYVKLTADIDLAGENWEPIGKNSNGDHENFLGTFYGEKADGTKPTISNLYINADGDYLGFFARVGSYDEGLTPTVKNIKFNNVDVSSNTTNSHSGSYVAGVIANAGGNSVVSGIEVTGNVYVVGYGYIGGIVGHGYPDIDDCHVAANDGSYINSHYWCVGGIIGYAGEGGTPITNSSVSGVDIWSAYGGAAAIAGLLNDGNKLENVSASNVDITSNSDYYMGYIAGNGNASTMTGISIENVTATAKGNPITPTDAVAKINDAIYFSLQEAFAAAAEGETITLLADATPALTSQRAITKAAVIDLGGNTLTLTEDDLYFGTTTFKNGTIVVDPSVKPSTAVFWMFANQTLTFDAVKVVATGVTGTYLIGLDGNNSDLNLLNGSEILIENTTALDLDVICVNASTGNDIVVENSKVNVTNLDGRVFFRGNYTVKDSEVSLAGITKAGFRIEAGQTLSIEGTSTVTIEGEPRDGGIHITDATATYTKAETATVNATVNAPAQGSNSFAYTKEENGYVRVWGEGGGNAKESYELKLYSGETLIATTKLNNIDNVINGDVYVTWNFYYPQSTDEYWTTTWEDGHPNSAAQPTEVELYIDGTLVATTAAKMSGADDVNPVVWRNLGGVAIADLLGEGTAENPYLIETLKDLKFFRDDVNTYTQDGSNQYKGKYVKLTADIDLAGENWEPIGKNSNGDHQNFLGTFYGEKADGTKPTISNLYINADGDHLGFFARVGSYAEGLTPTVKNIKFNNVDVSSNITSSHNGSYVAGVIANAGGNSVVSGIEVTGNVYVEGYGYIGGIVGHGYPDIDNCHVAANDGSYINSHFWCAGGIIGYAGEGGTPITNSSVSGVDIWSASGAAAAIAGLLNDGNKLENVSASNVEITSNSDYCMGYIAGNGNGSTMTGISIENVTATAKGNPITPTDAVAKINDAIYFSLQEALDAAAAGTGNVTVTILADVNLTGIDWNPVTVSATGYPLVTVEGGNHTITGLNDMLFHSTWAGNSGLIIKDLTIANSAIVNDKDDAAGTVGVGAFIGYPQASATITLENCHLENSSVEGGHWTGGLIGMAGGYNGEDGPVFMNLTIKGCSVTGSTITGKGSVGGVIGHGSCSAWTNVVIEETTVEGNTITSTGSSNVKAGAIMGTIGAAGQPATANGVTKTGGASVSATVAGNTVTSNGTAITTIYGRQGTETGMLYVAGGSYDKYPIEQNVAYAAPIEGYEIVQNTDGTYGIQEAPEASLAGEGTEANPFLISSVDDLVLFRNSVNAGETKYSAPGIYVALGADIDLAGENWTPIGNITYNSQYKPEDASKVFSGVFNGNGKVISNLKVASTVGGADTQANVGLFGITGEGAVIKDLTLTNVNIETDGRNVGAIAGFAYKATLKNITVNGNIQIKGGNNVAGIAGMTRYYDMSATDITVSGADGSAIVGNNIVGGIFAEIAPNGSVQEFTGLNIENVAVTGVGGVGGIVGLLTTGAVENVSVKNVVLTGRTDYQGNAMGRIRLGSVAGLMGGKYATIANETVENVTAKNLDGNAVELPVIGANYDAASNATEAKIGNTYYNTLLTALNAAQAGETVTLLADVETADGIVITDKNLVIDLNDKTYITTEGASTNNRNFKIEGTSVVTIKNGTMVAAGEYSSGAYGTVRTEGNANVTLEGLKLYNYRGNGLNIKAYSGTTVTVKDTEIYANYGGGIESAGGTIVVDNVTVEQKGMYIAPYNSMAISVNGGGKVTVNSGTFSTECITAEEADNQGTSHGPWVAGVLNSGGTLIINGGTFSNDNFGENSLATYARGAILADTKAKVEINGGTFNVLKNVIDIQNNLGDANNNPSVVLAGGTYSADPRESAQYGSNLITLADGYTVVENGDGTYGIVEAPKAPEVVDGKIEFIDGEFDMYTNDTDIENVEITYKRTISNKWNAIYLPFEIPASELLDNFDIAYINDVRETDADDDGELDSWQMELIKIKKTTATLKANHPYFIRSKSAEYDENNLSLTLTTTLYKATAAEFECSSVYSTYTIKGLNSLRHSSEFADNERVVGIKADGTTSWGKIAEGYSLKPFRFYLSITNHDGSPVVSGSAQMSIVVRDEDGTTGIDGIYGDENGETVIFDLYGRRVLEPEKGNIYIINGKKVLVK